MSNQIPKFHQGLSAIAKPFSPGKPWMKPKKVSWYHLGITEVRYFDVKEGAYARQKGEYSCLINVPVSSIKNANPTEATPFKILDRETSLTIIEEKIKNHLQQWYPWALKPENKLVRTQPSRFNYCDN